MANLSSLLHDLRERIASSSSPTAGGEDPLEIRFRTVLPNLLHDYVVPSSNANEREVIAVLKLLSHIAKNFPGVFFHGKASVVLPVIGRILPFFSEPTLLARHAIIFETLGSLLSLLRVGDKEVYRQFFLDTTTAVEDILCHVATVLDQSNVSTCRIMMRFYALSFAQISEAPNMFSELPICCKPKSGSGLLVDITDMTRWRPFATWTIKLISKCLTEGTLYVEGLVILPLVNTVGTILCYGDAPLDMACFDLMRILAAIMGTEVIPFGNAIRSILFILEGGEEKFARKRNLSYDSSMGACLHVLYTTCENDVVASTASELVSVFPKAIRSTESSELQAALCSGYARIAKICPVNTWKPEMLLSMIHCTNPCLSLINCIQVAFGLLGPDFVGDDMRGFSSDGVNQFNVGKRRLAQGNESANCKRQKINNNEIVHAVESDVSCKYANSLKCKRDKEYAHYMREKLLLFVTHSKCNDFKGSSLSPESSIMALSILCNVFFRFPGTNFSISIFQNTLCWIPWICEQAKDDNDLTFDFPFYLETVRKILFFQGTLPASMRSFKDKYHSNTTDDTLSGYSSLEDLIYLIKLAWGHPSSSIPPWKNKSTSVQILATMGNRLGDDNYLEMLDMAIHDEAEEVRVELASSLPIYVCYSGCNLLDHAYERLVFLINGASSLTNNIAPLSLGYLSCLLASYNGIDDSNRTSCTLFLSNLGEMQFQTLDILSKGFRCSRCDKGVQHCSRQEYQVFRMPKVQKDDTFKFNHTNLQLLFFQFIFGEFSEICLVSCVRVIPRILQHCTSDDLHLTRLQWIRCIDDLLLHKIKAVRDAFSTEISIFTDESILDSLFVDLQEDDSKEIKFVERLKHALSATVERQILETILESIGEIMNSLDVRRDLFYHTLILLVDQLDSPHVAFRMVATKLICRTSYLHVSGGFDVIISKYSLVRDKLFDYLCAKLITRPELISEFAHAVLGIKTEELLTTMVPYVTPKLVTSHADNDQAIVILDKLANHLNTATATLIVNWCPKVLAFTLLRADERELALALQFYHLQTGSDIKEIFSAALPALLDELICFKGDDDLGEMEKRTTRIPEMIQEVARILIGSDNLSVFLKSHFVGLLNSVDRKLLHSDDPVLQKQALKRIKKLIEMMGSSINNYVPKIMVLLMHAVGKDLLQVDGLAVLNFFVKQLAKLSPSSTRHVMSQVVAGFIPFLERYEEISPLHTSKIVEVLEGLFVENMVPSLKQHIRELPLLPSIPALSKINSVIEDARGSISLRDQLRNAVTGLNHESLNVRYMVACELNKLLKSRREDITSLIAGEAVSDMDTVSTLIISLLKGCSEESRTSVGQRLKLVSADCLGALGAVDPAKFKGVSSQRFKIECTDDDLIFELIDKHLARAFRAASDAIVQDSAALAIQELLKFAGCQASLDNESSNEVLESYNDNNAANHDIMNSRGQRLWDRFSNYIKDIIAPCLTSRFQLPSVKDSTSSGPIYRPFMSFRKWVFFWIRKLTVHATGPRASIFTACRGIIRHDMQTAVYLLPYLVLNAVCHGTSEARDGITEEILSVLNAAAAENSDVMVHGIGGQSEVCVQTIFTLLDNLGQWVDDLKQEVALSQSLSLSSSKHSAKTRNAGNTSDVEQLLVQCNNVSELLAVIPKVTLARASFRCQAYARALLYFESYVQEKAGSFNIASERNGEFIDEDISFLMEIYSGLDEPDGLFGLVKLKRLPSLSDQLRINEKVGNWAEVLTSSEQALQMEPTSVERHSGVLNCLLNMCHLQSMVTHVDGLITRIPHHKRTWCMQGVQAAWRLGRWDLMGEYLTGSEVDTHGLSYSSLESTASFDIDLARILQAMMKKDQFAVAERIAQSKQALILPLAAAGMDSYMRAYPFVVKLHMLCELEDFHSLLGDESFLEKSFDLDDPNFANAVKDWDNRLRFTQPSLWAREPLLAFRRLVFCASNMGPQVGNCWLQYAKLCRSAGHYEIAHRAILEAHASGAPNVHMEKAKLLWSTRKSDSAIAELQQSLLNMPVEVLGSAANTSLASLSLVPPNPSSLPATQAATDNENFDVARMLLLYTRWIHHTGQKQKGDVITLYTRVRELQPRWEKGYFFLAKYFDDLLVDARKRQEELQASKDLTGGVGHMTSSSAAAGGNLRQQSEEKPWWSHLPDVLLFYAKGLHKGHKILFQALPRLLTLWFEFGSMYQRDAILTNKELKTVHTRVMSIMRGCLKDLPAYQWLIVLSQLISRICHQNDDVVRVVKHIIISVIQEYPQQALWMMAAVSKSTIAARRNAATEIIQCARKGARAGNDNSSLFIQFATLIDHLIKLCFHPGQSRAKSINIATEFSALKRMMPLGIIMPVQESLTVTLPSYDAPLNDFAGHNIFSGMDLPTISGIADEAEILSSLQKPKKVIFLGSDGVFRPFLCKPKDDLRKDARMMEFTAMINRLLSKFPESRRRKLYIRTFAVIPLTEDCGMVEWVPNTRGLRQILQDIYIACGKFDRQKTHPLIKRMYDQFQGKIPEDDLLKLKILPMFPPVFRKWFISTFSEPAAWFRARTAYAHTAAVWSMVGHIVGLGDRHGENILFDSTTGDCVHVDFSCLFDKGLQLEKPELVPFRLTQNMIDGLGITGYEGVFLKVCEITLTVLRTNRETLMSVLETFIHDPLVEWTKSHKSSGVEVQNPHGQRAISNIKARLQGVVVGVGAAPSLPLAVEGQVRRLIAEAVSLKNLGKMYIWWMPWF